MTASVDEGVLEGHGVEMRCEVLARDVGIPKILWTYEVSRSWSSTMERSGELLVYC